ncbi:MAG: hypothetical protein JWP85_1111 [Rhodoglobus sp.]|nr:hypothetical protein [Rhodoglobus sp.]
MTVNQKSGGRTNRPPLWSVPILAAAVGLGFAAVALQTDDVTLAADPCASSLDNPFTWVSQIVFLAGIGASLAIIVRSAFRRNRDGVFAGVVAVVAGVVVMLFGLVLASAGYGWRCPDY